MMSKWHNTRIKNLKEELQYSSMNEEYILYLQRLLEFMKKEHHVDVDRMVEDYNWSIRNEL